MSGSGYLERQVDIAPVDYPWEGQPRHFTAAAMPQGDPQFGVEGHLVLVIESRGGAIPRQKLYSRAEAAQLYDQLRQALGAFTLGESLAQEPGGAHGPFPFNHRSMAEVIAAEREQAAFCVEERAAGVERQIHPDRIQPHTRRLPTEPELDMARFAARQLRLGAEDIRCGFHVAGRVLDGESEAA